MSKIKLTIAALSVMICTFVFAQIAKSLDAPQDVTSSIDNPTLDENTDGWISTTGAQNHALATNKVDGVVFTGKFLENWNPESFTGEISQEISNLSSGVYKLTMGAFVNNSGAGTYVFANDEKSLPVLSDVPTFYTVFVALNEVENLKIGLVMEEATNNWVGIDNPSLTYYGSSTTPLGAAESEYQALVGEAQALIDLYQNPVELEALQAKMTSNATTWQEAYQAAIELADAIPGFKKANDLASLTAPADATFAIINPDANEGNNGWTITGSMNSPTAKESWLGEYAKNPYFDGGNWGASSWTTTMSQSVLGLPAGKYVLKAAARAAASVELVLSATVNGGETKTVCPSVGNVGGSIWEESEDGSVEKGVNGGKGFGWSRNEVAFEMAEGEELVIGVSASTGAQQQWFSIGEFALFYVEATEEPEPEEIPDFVEAEAYEDIKSYNFRDVSVYPLDSRITIASLTEEVGSVGDVVLYKSTIATFDGLIFEPAKTDNNPSWWVRNRNSQQDWGLAQINDKRWFAVYNVKAGYKVTIEASTGMTLADSAYVDIVQNESTLSGFGVSYTYKVKKDCNLAFYNEGCYMHNIKVEAPIVYEEIKSYNFRDAGVFPIDTRIIGASLTEEAGSVGDITLYKSTNSIFDGLIFEPAKDDNTQSWWVRARNTGTDWGLAAINQTRWFAVNNLNVGYKVTVEAAKTMVLADSTLVDIVQNESTLSGYGISYTYTMKEDGFLAFLNEGCYMYRIIVQAPEGVLVAPSIAITKVNGVNREVTITTVSDGEIRYTIDGGEENVYAEPFSVAETSVIAAYITKNGKSSDISTSTIAAGTEISLATPVITKKLSDGGKKTYTVTIDNSNILLSPVASFYYSINDGERMEYTEPVVCESGKLVFYAEAEGYTTTEAEVYADVNEVWTTVKSVQLKGIPADADVFNLMREHGWKQATDSIGSTLELKENEGSDKNADNLYYLDGEIQIQYFPDLTAAFDTYIIEFTEEGSKGIYSQSSGGRAVAISGIAAGQYVEFVIDGVSNFIVSGGTTASYTMDRYKTLEAVNVYAPSLVISENTEKFDVYSVIDLTVEYSENLNVVQDETVNVNGRVYFKRVMNSGYNSIVLPFAITTANLESGVVAITDADGNSLTRGEDYTFYRMNLSAEGIECTEYVGNIVAYTQTYLLTVSEELVGKEIVFVSPEGVNLGTGQTNFNQPTSGLAARTNRRFEPVMLDIPAYILNADGTAFELVTPDEENSVIVPAFQACILATDEIYGSTEVLSLVGPDAIDEIDTDGKEIESVKYYTVSGVELSAPVQGIIIKRIVYVDGTSKTVKVFVK